MSTARFSAILGLFCCLLLAPLSRGADDPDVETLTSKGLVKNAAGQYVLAGEQEVIDAMKNLRLTKAKMDAELRTRRALDQQIDDRKEFIKDGERRHTMLEEKAAEATDVTIHNQYVSQMNQLYVKMKEAYGEQKELEEKASKVGVTIKADYVDQMMAISAKADAAKAKYAELDNDADVKAAVEHINATAKVKIKVAPSGPFTAASNQLRVWRNVVESESIPLFQEGGVNEVDVLLNGVAKRMIVDSGASAISLPAEVGTQLGLEPGPNDPVVHVMIADGSSVRGHQMTLKSVRVGRFSMENVECILLDPTPNKAPSLLGNTFLSHFVVKLDQEKSELHLTELSKDDKKVKMVGGDAPPGSSHKAAGNSN